MLQSHSFNGFNTNVMIVSKLIAIKFHSFTGVFKKGSDAFTSRDTFENCMKVM